MKKTLLAFATAIALIFAAPMVATATTSINNNSNNSSSSNSNSNNNKNNSNNNKNNNKNNKKNNNKNNKNNNNNKKAPAPVCQSGTPPPSNQYPGVLVVATSFESGTLKGFIASTSGTGTAAVTSDQHHSGGCAAFLHVTDESGSVANMSATLPGGSSGAYADGWFNITTAGNVGNNVPYFRFFNGGIRVADVFRDNGNGQLWLRVASPSGTYGYTNLGLAVQLGSWHKVVMHVVANGAASTVEVWFDARLLYSNQVSTGFTTLTRVQLGAEHPRQVGDSYIDDVIIKAS
ncbi:hypothetical protein ACQCSU_13715 [Pseudarthrobacter sp. O4]|uniref:hypothetical protein n=1 Tax=Pseudarthrobacter sp. O4 TaxID=3418417 RepID=UPI003CF02B8B